MMSPVLFLLEVLLAVLALSQGSPIQIQTFLVETNTSVLCREGVCISEDPDKHKCPVDFFESECPGYEEYCGAPSHRGQWMSLFCKATCHCAAAHPGGDQCCPQAGAGAETQHSVNGREVREEKNSSDEEEESEDSDEYYYEDSDENEDSAANTINSSVDKGEENEKNAETYTNNVDNVDNASYENNNYTTDDTKDENE